MKREELLKSKEYWISQLQIHLFETVEDYLKDNNISRSEFAAQIGVSKSYVTQVLNGDFDHKISKYVELMMACNKVPIVNIMDLDVYIGDEMCHYKHVLSTEPKSISISNEVINRSNNIGSMIEISYLNGGRSLTSKKHINKTEPKLSYY